MTTEQLVSLERDLTNHKIALRGNRERASGPKANAIASAAYAEFDTVLSMLEHRGDTDLRAMAERVRAY